MQHKICAVIDNIIKILNLLQSVVTKHALGCRKTAKTADTIEAEILLKIYLSKIEKIDKKIQNCYFLVLNDLSDCIYCFFVNARVLRVLAIRKTSVIDFRDF